MSETTCAIDPAELAEAIAALRSVSVKQSPRRAGLPITMKQRKILRLVATACVNGDDSPTVRGLAAEVDLTPSTVFHNLHLLEVRGLVASRPGRRLDITPAGRMELDGAP